MRHGKAALQIVRGRIGGCQKDPDRTSCRSSKVIRQYGNSGCNNPRPATEAADTGSTIYNIRGLRMGRVLNIVSVASIQGTQCSSGLTHGLRWRLKQERVTLAWPTAYLLGAMLSL